MNHYFWLAFGAFVISFLMTFLAVKVFPKLGLLDRPWKYGLKRGRIPYYGGLVIFLVFLLLVVAVFSFGETFAGIDFSQFTFSPQLIGFLIAASMIAVLGFLDDLFSLSPIIRLLVQFLAVCILIYSGIFIDSINLPILGFLDFTQWEIGGWPIIAFGLTVFWVMGIINSLNFVDGVSGLSSGVTFISGLSIFLLSINSNLHADPSSQITIAILSLLIAFVALGFFVFDFPKPKILMGDTGSTFLGFTLASLAIFAGTKLATVFIVLGIPILDMVWAILRRTYNKKKFWQGDLDHLHHRLMEIGFSKRQVVLAYLSLTAIFGFLAVFLVGNSKKFFLIISLIILVILIASLLVFSKKKR